jgi:hypothetical protein
MANQLKIWVDKILNEQLQNGVSVSSLDPALQEAADRRAEQEDVLEGPVNTNPTRNPNPQNPSVDPATDDL